MHSNGPRDFRVALRHQILLIFYSASIPCAATSKRPWQFSEDIMLQTPYSQHLPISKPPAQTHYSFAQIASQNIENNNIIDNESLQSVVNITSLVYVLFQIYKTYQEIYVNPGQILENNDSYLMQTVRSMIVYACPQFLISLGKHSQFLISSLAITLTVLIYKTIIKLILLSADGDILDFFGAIAARLAKILKTIVVC